jgi:hypothetical protein
MRLAKPTLFLASAVIGAISFAYTRMDPPMCGGRKLGGRAGAMLVYHQAQRRVLLFGGQSSDIIDRYPSSLWAWDGARWTCVAADGPPGRAEGKLVLDPVRNRLVLFGGRRTGLRSELLSDTWEWDGQRWSLRDSVGPSPRIHMVAAYDSSRRGVLLVGGFGPPGPDPLLHDAWLWNGARWSQVNVSGAPATLDHHHAMLETGRGLVMIDAAPRAASNCQIGFHVRARLFALRGESWIRVDSGGPCFAGAAPTSSTAEGILVFAEWNDTTRSGASDAWVWRDNKWQHLASAPSPRKKSEMAFDPSRGRVILFGGSTPRKILNETWEWDGAQWELRTPPAR